MKIVLLAPGTGVKCYRESIIQSFATQRLMNPDIKKPVGHISLNYSVEDAPKLTDLKMIDLAHEYMKEMGIVNTQYIIVCHHDRKHPHVHIVFNWIDNNGKTITDQNDRYRNEQVCKRLKQKYGLYFAPGKENVKQDRLKEPDKTKYEIYNVIKSGLKYAKDWQLLQGYLSKEGIQIRFKYKGQTNEVQGISFTKGEYSFKGSEIDRSFSYSKLDAQLNRNSQQQQETVTIKPDYSTPKETNSGFGKNGNLFGFSNSGSMPDDGE
ncbi:relaxase/mobilization nuclease domain-containing protein [Culturomica massiliensis]|uniref:relaxase/mobilization nuclease domain-containing protein n=1 Tax=Culturomica massiliensis TaxID=1841857 RepID=UPI001F3D815B|nr:relaxase/mobilization nuclease domain-containing protein [Culturomica massiliensis]